MLCSEVEANIGSYDGRLDVKEDGKLVRSALGSLLGAHGGAEIGSSNVR